LRDVAGIIRLVPTVRRAAAVVSTVEPIGISSEVVFGRVLRVTPDYQTIAGLRITHGRRLLGSDIQRGLPSCLVGRSIANVVSRTLDVTTARVRVASDWCRVVGILARTDSVGDVQAVDADIVAPLLSLVDDIPVDEIWVQLESGADVIRESELIRQTLLEVHRRQIDFELLVPQALLNERLKAQRRFDAIVGTAAALILTVGGIGILNVMLGSVVARIPEIGLRRVSGATRHDIFGQFVFEGVAISLLGALLGITSGIVAVFMLTSRLGWRADISLAAIVFATFASLSVGFLSSAYPAARAAAVQPIEAVRYE
jgi:putative ABC transport system permease protein